MAFSLLQRLTSRATSACLRALVAMVAVAAGIDARAYVIGDSRWNASVVTMQLQLGSSRVTLLDGSASWGEVAEAALAIWNAKIASSQFAVVRDSAASKAGGNRANNVFFSDSIYGDAWGKGVLAVTITYSQSNGNTTETDVLFNSAILWDSYRTSLRYSSTGSPVYDFRRVALHEFGHALGLDHPDQAGQSVQALMNSRITSLDNLEVDDVNGAQAIYGKPAPVTPPPATSAPTIGMHPVSQAVNVGASVTLSVSGTGTPAPSYQWYKDGTQLSGATAASYAIVSARLSDAGTYSVRLSNSAGSVVSSGAVLTIQSTPVIGTSPTPQTVTRGDRISLQVTASGTPAPAFQWRKDGLNIPGATSSTLVIASATPADAGAYSVLVSNPAGSVASSPVQVSVRYSQLANLSTRGSVPAGGALTAGFVLRGSAGKPILSRGIGPALQDFGLSGTLGDPGIAVIPQSSSQPVATNDSWGQTGQLASVFQALGAFPLPAGSADAALRVTLLPAGYTARVTANSPSQNGIALAEIYDGDLADTRARLVNLSSLGIAGTADNALVAGFAVHGNAPKRVLIRAVGPTLSQYAVDDLLANPKLDVYPLGSSTVLATNDDWSGADVRAAFTASGAFALPDNSRDAALILTLAPGGYTIVVTSADGAVGKALVEIYDLDP